jgi:hemoglobin
MTNESDPEEMDAAGRRAAISQDIRDATGLDEALLQRLVQTFYGKARQDDLIGPIFARVEDWEKHIAAITEFWASVALLTGTYQGRPLAAHLPLDLQPGHFLRWLALFEQTVREICPPEGAALLIEKAHRIAKSLEMGAAVHRGELPAQFNTRSSR